jgi:hypothetical protein
MNTQEVVQCPRPDQKRIHPLYQKELSTIYNWYEWLESWSEARYVEDLASLIHCGWKVTLRRAHSDEQPYEENDRVAFFLKIADGRLCDALEFPENVDETKINYPAAS